MVQEQKAPAPTPPPAPPPEAPPLPVLSVARTSGVDRYIVRTERPEGGFTQSILSADETRAAGGIVPTGDRGYVQRYEGTSLYGDKDKTPSAPYGFAEELEKEQGVSQSEAIRLTELAIKEPDAPELTTVPVDIKQKIVSDLAPKGEYHVLEGRGITPQIASTRAVRKLSGIDPNTVEYHDALKSLRLIPKERVFVAPAKAERQAQMLQVAIGTLRQAGVLGEKGQLDPKAFSKADRDKEVRQALIDVGLTTLEINEGIKFQKEHIQLPDGDYVRIDEWNELPEKYQSIAMNKGIVVAGKELEKDIKDFEARHIRLPDGEYLRIDDWNELPDKYKTIALQGGYGKMNKALSSDIAKQNVLLASLDKPVYKNKENYDVAKFIRDNPQKEKELLILFEQKDIAQAKEFNKEYLGVGVVQHIPRRDFIQQYFDAKKWNYKLHRGIATDKELRDYDRHLLEANKKYEAQYAPTVSHKNFIANYFAEKGWETKIHRGVAPQKEINIYDKHLSEATHAYIDKFGVEPVITQGLTKVADMVIPGFYVARAWKELSAPERALNIALDALFIGIIFAKPTGIVLRAGGRAISQTTVYRGGREFANIIRQTYGTGEKQLIKLAGNIDHAIRSGRIERIVSRAEKLREYAVAMKERGVIGADKLIENAAMIRDNAQYVASLSKTHMPKVLNKALKDLNKEVKQLQVVQVVEGPGAASLKQPIVVKEAGKKTAIVPLTREEVRGFGLTEADVNTILGKVGTNRNRFFQEAETLRKVRTEKLFDDINRQLGRQPIRQMAPERPGNVPEIERERMLSAERARIQAERTRLAQSRRERGGQIKAKVQEGLRERWPERLEAWRIGMAKIVAKQPKTSSQIVGQAIKNEAMYNTLAAKAIAQYKDMSINRAIVEMTNDGLVNVVASRDPAYLSKLYTQTSVSSRERLNTQLNTTLRNAVRTANETRTKAIALTNVKTIAKILAQVKAKEAVATRTLAKVQTKTLTKAQTKALSKAELSAIAKATTTTLIKTTPVTSTAKAIKQIIVTKTPVRVTPSVKIPTPRLKITKPIGKLPLPHPRKPIKGKPIKIPKPLPILLRRGGGRKARQPIPQGSITWAQGRRKGGRGELVSQWYFIPPPYNMKRPISLGAPPIGALNAGSASPYDTIQIIGDPRATVPAKVDVDLGFVDIKVLNGRRILFEGGGEETDVGTRELSPTVGMDVDEGDMSRQVRKRKIKSPPKPRPKRKRGDDNTSLSGMRI